MGRTFKRKSEAAKHYRWWQSSSWWDNKCSCEPWRNLSELRFFLFDRGILCHFSEHWRSSRLHCIGKSLSKACQKRALKESQCEEDDKKFPEWRREHLTTGECDINFNGSSPALEAEWAFILWRRSIELQKKHYKWMVSNGDRKAFKTFWKSVHVGLKVITLDCTGHAQKRMWMHLLKLKARTKENLNMENQLGGAGGSLIQK